MVLIDAFFGLLCAAGVFGFVFQVGLVANWYILKQGPKGESLNDLLQPPDGIEEALIRSDNSTLISFHKGSGPVVVLLPDLGKKSLSMNRLWKFFASYGYRVITFDWAGHGNSTLPESGLTPDQMEQDIHLLFSHYGLQNAFMIGHGRGANAMLKFLHQNPSFQNRVRGWASLGAAHNPASDTTLPWHQRILTLPISQSLLSRRLTGWGYSAHAFGDNPSEASLRAYPNCLQLPFPPNYLQSYTQLSTLAAPLRIAVPGLVIHGRMDKHTPASHARRLSRTLPGAQLHITEQGLGHMMIWEHAKSLVERIREFDRSLNT